MKKAIGQDQLPVIFNNSTYAFQSFACFGQAAVGISANMLGAGIAGTALLEASSDGVLWGTIADSSHTIAGPELYQWNLTSYGFPYVRVKIISTNANDMTVTVKSYAKEA